MAGVKSKLAAGAIGAAVVLMPLEGYMSRPYFDSAGVLTDCYGNTKNVQLNKIRSKEVCLELLQGETFRIAKLIDSVLPNLSVNELIAITSFTYNVGDSAFLHSTLRKRFAAGEHLAGCTEMRRWNKITLPGTNTKVVLPGLNNRRQKEVEVCVSTEPFKGW